MKKRDLASLALLGISAGLFVGSCQKKDSSPPASSNTSAAEQLSPNVQAFYNSLSPDAQRQFREMTPQRRAMSMEMLQQSCHGQNTCKGLGGCGTKAHACAAKNACKGEGGPAIHNANKAIDAQYRQQMGEQPQWRHNLHHTPTNP